jgi:hypothetical protein
LLAILDFDQKLKKRRNRIEGVLPQGSAGNARQRAAERVLQSALAGAL